MKTALWEQSPGALAALINTGSFAYAQLYTIVLADGGGTIRLTDGDFDITDTTDTWDSGTVRIDKQESRATGRWKRGLDVDQWMATFLPRSVDSVTGDLFPDTINGSPWVSAARQGALDGATVYVDRAYFASWPQPYRAIGTPVGILRIFAGRAAEVDVTDSEVIVTINDFRELLTTKMPRHVYQAQCRHTLYDAGCTLTPASFAVATMAIGGTTRSVLKSNVAGPPGSATYTLGKIKMTSGLNSGFSRTVSQWTPGSFSLLNPLPFEVLPGDTFTAYAGCDRSLATCALFANTLNYGGQPYVPDSSTVT